MPEQMLIPSVAESSFGTEALTLSHDIHRKRWVFHCGYDSRHIAKDHGFYWDKEEKEWYTVDPFSAMKLIHYADGECRKKLAKYWNFAAGNFQDSRLSNGDLKEGHQDIHIPIPHGCVLKDYQRIGVEFLIRSDERCSNTLLGDEMGLGKTIMIIAALNYLSDSMSGRKLRRALIVCPASLKLNWGRELRKWLVGPLSWGIADSQGFPRNRDIVIINYDILEKWQPLINSISWDLLVADEAHYLKNPGTKRSKLFYGIAADRRIYATGTPIVNRPRELFALVNSLDVEQFPQFIGFAIRYCNGRKIGSTWDCSGDSNLDELQARLRATIMLRRLKRDVLKELPPKTRNIIELPCPRGIGDLLRREVAAYEEKEPMLEALKVRIAEAKSANDTEAYAQAVDQFRTTIGQVMGDVSTLRKEVAIAKVPLVIAYLEDLWKGDPERKIVLWCHHHVVMDAFLDRFKSFGTKVRGAEVSPAYAMKFSGNETIQKRDETVQRFQNDPRFLLFIGQTLAGGVGITLTASSHAIFAELDWVPGNITQAEDRLHRIGQHDNVLVEHLVLEGSLDCRIAQRVVEKQMVIDAAMNTPTTHLNQHSMMGA